MFKRKANLLTRKSGTEVKTNFDMLRRTPRRKKFMGKMSDIIKKELQSESDDYLEDEEEDRDFLDSPKKSKKLCVKISSLNRESTTNLDYLGRKNKEDKNNEHSLVDHDSQMFSLSTDSDDDDKTDTFDLSTTLGTASSESPSFDLTKSIRNSSLATSLSNTRTASGLNTGPSGSSVPESQNKTKPLPEASVSSDDAGKKKSWSSKVLSKTATQYYRQLYRPAWEEVPEFKGWLSSVESNPSKALCIYCNAILAAHSVSLMKHVASSKHQRNAEKIYIMNSDLYVPHRRFIKYNNEKNDSKADKVDLGTKDVEEDDDVDEVSQDSSGDAEKKKARVTFSSEVTTSDVSPRLNPASEGDVLLSASSSSLPTLLVEQSASHQNSMEDLLLPDNVQIILAEDDEDGKDANIVTLNDLDDDDTLEDETNDLVQMVKHSKEDSRTNENPSSPVPSFQPISTHVIDSHVGRPISNLEITLYKLVDGRWRFVSEIVTNAGGRASDFYSDPKVFQCGRYKLHYHVFKYFQMRKVSSIFPFIEVPFDVRSLTDHLHFPLILSANGYNVYKGCAH